MPSEVPIVAPFLHNPKGRAKPTDDIRPSQSERVEEVADHPEVGQT